MEAPEDYLRLAERKGWPYKMVDVEEGGEVVQTTLIRYPSEFGERLDLTWYRGQARCEAAKRAAGQRAQEREQEIQRKYR